MVSGLELGTELLQLRCAVLWRRVRREKLHASAVGELAHLVPQRHRGVRVVARVRGELDADGVGLGFALAAIRQPDRDHRGVLHELATEVAHAGGGGQDLHADVGGARDRHALARVIEERVADLVAHHLRELVVRGLQLLPHAGVDRHLAAGHAERVDGLRIVDHAHFPAPARRIDLRARVP